MRENHNKEVINKGQPNPLAIADKKSQPDLSDKIQKEVKKKRIRVMVLNNTDR